MFEDCGNPRLTKRGAGGGGFGYSNPGLLEHNKPLTAAGTNLDNLVNDIMTGVKSAKGFWTKLPYILCQNPEVGSGKDRVEQNCWTGRQRGSYEGRVTSDGLAAQEHNPEVEVDTSLADAEINEQIFALRLVINKLENAYNGHAVNWPHYEPRKFRLVLRLATLVPGSEIISLQPSCVEFKQTILLEFPLIFPSSKFSNL